MKREWINAGCKEVANPKSGTRTVVFPLGNIIYNETPRTAAGGHRFMAIGGEGTCVCDIDSMAYTPIGETTGGLNTSYNEYVYFANAPAKPGDPDEVFRVSLVTLKREKVLSIHGLPKPGGFFTGVSPRNDYLVYLKREPGLSEIIRVNIPDGTWKVILKDPEPLRHIQVEPTTGDWIFVQQNRGGKVDENGVEIHKFLVGKEGCTHFYVSSDGARRVALPVGPPHTLTCGGHSAWICGTQRVVLNVLWNLNEFSEPGFPADWSTDERWPGATLFTTGPGETRPIPIVTSDQRFFHVSSSRCGRYYIGDSVPTRMGPTQIVIGNLATGKYRTFVDDCLCYAGSCWPCSLPYFSADLKYVMYREKDDASIPKYGGFKCYAAELTPEFLRSLD